MTPGPTLPAEEQLGDLLLLHDRPAEALAAYARALAAYPERFNSLLGVARAAQASGNHERARQALDHLMSRAKDGPRRRAADEWAREVLSR